MSLKQFAPHSIFNFDESGITTVHAVPKVLAAKGTKQVGQITATERGALVTVGCCVNAAGCAIPPVMVFLRVNFKEHFLIGAPAGTLGLAAQSGRMNFQLFPKVLDHCIKHMGCSKDKPAVLSLITMRAT